MIFQVVGLSAGDISIVFTAVIYPVVKVHRRSGSATREPGSPVVPAIRWSVGFM